MWIAIAACGTVMPVAAQAPAEAGVRLLEVVREAIRLNPNNQLQQQQVQASKGSVMQAQGQFDPLWTASTSRQRELRPLRQDEVLQLEGAGVPGLDRQTTDTNSIQAGVQQTLVNGIGIGASLSSTSSADSASQFSGIPSPQALGRLNFTVRVPLLRNLGRESTGAALTAAEAEYRAAYQDLVQANAQSVLNATLAYWDYVARQRRLQLAIEAERRAIALLQDMEKLVRADQVPRAETGLLNASRAEKSASRSQSEQGLTEARASLARAIGLDGAASLTLGVPADDFPAAQSQDVAMSLHPAALREAALGARADLAAAREREEAARVRVVAARNNLKPQVDLNLNAGYTGLGEGSKATDLDRLYKRRIGPTFNASVSMQLPQGNTAAEGILLAQSAAHDASTIRVRELEASIITNVTVRADALRRSASQLVEGAEAVRRYATTLENEKTKRRLGQATLIDVLNVQDRYENALSLQVQLQQAHASAIAQLRFELGALVHKEGGTFDVRLEDLTAARFQP